LIRRKECSSACLSLAIAKRAAVPLQPVLLCKKRDTKIGTRKQNRAASERGHVGEGDKRVTAAAAGRRRQERRARKRKKEGTRYETAAGASASLRLRKYVRQRGRREAPQRKKRTGALRQQLVLRLCCPFVCSVKGSLAGLSVMPQRVSRAPPE